MLAEAPNWAEQLTAIGTAVLALSVLGAAAAAVFAGQQVREARQGRQAEAAIEFFRRWNEDAMTEARRLIASFSGPGELATAFTGYIETNAPEAYVLYRELDFFEQLAVLERTGAFDFETIKLMVGTCWLRGGTFGSRRCARPTASRPTRCSARWRIGCAPRVRVTAWRTALSWSEAGSAGFRPR